MCSSNVLCPLCSNSSFENVDSLRISLIKAANSAISCPQCNEVFLGLDKLTIHLFSHSNVISNIDCEQSNDKVCSKVPTISFSTANHNQKAVNLNGTSCINFLHKCDICEFSFRSDELLKMHFKLKHQIRLIATENSDEPFGNQERNSEMDYNCLETNCTEAKQKENYTLSNTVSTNPLLLYSVQDKNSYSKTLDPCADEMSTELSTSTKDMKLNESAKIWECDICTKSFTTKYFLKKHKRLHTGEMPYSCEICGRTFTFQQSYHKHLLYHSDEKPHVCQTCNRAFKELSTLHNHERIHSGEKPFKCEICAKSFRQRVSFLVHTRIHTGVMPYKCSDCQKSFRYKLSLRTHKCLPLTAESRKSPIEKLLRSSTATPATDGELDVNLSTFEINIAKAKADEMHNNFFSKSIDEMIVESCSNLEIGSNLQNFNDSVVHIGPISQESNDCSSAKFQNFTPDTPNIEGSSVDHTTMINDTSFPQLLYDIGSGFL